jgi:hypothetical protein
MDRLSKKPSRPEIPSTVTGTDEIGQWLPLLCAGSAVAIGIFAIKEIKNTRKELALFKKENSEKMEKRMETIEDQLKSISELLKPRSQVPAPVQRPIPPKIKKEIIKSMEVEPEEIKIINEPFNEDEYEEVEVTDSESDE